MKIKIYIKELLFNNQGVVIPGLGGFVSEYEPAAFDVSKNKFLPPSKKITFNPEYSYHDTLLIDFVAKKEKISADQSKKLIDEFVKDTKYKLRKGEKVVFPEIGTIWQKKAQIHFEQNKESNLLTDSFGLKSIKAKQPTPEAIKPAKKQKKSHKKLIIITSILFIAALGITSIWYFSDGFSDLDFMAISKQKEQDKADNKLKEITERKLDSIAKADSLKAIIVHSIDNNTDKKDALFYEEPTEQEIEQKYTQFHIIAGSFKKMANAEKFSTEIKNKGYNPQIIKSEENLIRIAIYSYTDETEALKQLYKLRETSEINSVWILKSN